MFSAVLATVAVIAPTSGWSVRAGHVCAFRPLSARVSAIVERAWQDTEAQKRHQDDIQGDKTMGKKYSLEVDKELKPSEDKEAIARVQRIGAELAAVANVNSVVSTWGDKRLNPFDYEFKLVKDKDVNAFSLPGGYIYVYDGLVKFAESDDEIAGVLAHEIAHASLRHVATLQREQSRLQAVQIPLILLAIFTGGASAAGGALQVTSLVGTAIGSGWSVKAEQAADYAGFQYLALNKKYDATGMLTFMERLAVTERRRPMNYELGIYRTHPPSRERAESITGYMRKADIPIRRSRVSPSCRVEVKPGDAGAVQVMFGTRMLVAFSGDGAMERAENSARRLNTFFDSEPDLYELKSDPSGQVIGRRQVLIEIEAGDATVAKSTVPQLVESTTMNVKRAMGTLSFRVWNAF